jgi:hypothetical protein
LKNAQISESLDPWRDEVLWCTSIESGGRRGSRSKNVILVHDVGSE